MIVCPVALDVTEYSGGTSTDAGSAFGFTSVTTLATQYVDGFNGSEFNHETYKAWLTSIVDQNGVRVNSINYAVVDNSIFQTFANNLGSVGSTATGSFQINPYEVWGQLNGTLLDKGPVYYDNTTIEITDHIVGNETTDTTSTITVISGTLTYNVSANSLVPTSTEVTITVPTFTTISETDVVSTTTFDGTHYVTTTGSAPHGTTFTRASISCTPYLEYDAAKRWGLIYIPEANATQDDWVWYFNPPLSEITDWTGFTSRFTDFFYSTDSEFSASDTMSFRIVNYPSYNVTDTDWPSRAANNIATSFSSSESSFDDIEFPNSFISIRYKDGEIPTPTDEVEVDPVHSFPNTTSTDIAYTVNTTYSDFGVPEYTTTMAVGLVQGITHGHLLFFSEGTDGGRVMVRITDEQFFFANSIEQTIKNTVIFTRDAERPGYTKLEVIPRIGYFIDGGEQRNTFFGPTYIEGFQIQSRVAHTDPVYQFVGAAVSFSNRFNENVPGTTVECPYNDENVTGLYPTVITTTAFTVSTDVFTVTISTRETHSDTNLSLTWDSNGQPSFTVSTNSTSKETGEIFGGGLVKTVMDVFTQSHTFGDALYSHGRWRMGGAPRAGGRNSYYNYGGIEYTELVDGVTMTSTSSANGETFEIDPDKASGAIGFLPWRVYTNFYDDQQGILQHFFVFDKHTSRYFPI